MFVFRNAVIACIVMTSVTCFATMDHQFTPHASRFYVGAQVGDSISNDTHFQPDIVYPRTTRSIYFNPVNTDWTRDIGSAGFGGIFIGYNWCPNIGLQLSYDYRGKYNWHILTTESDPQFAPDLWDRYKAGPIKIQTLLFDMILRPTVNWGGFVPYVKAGIGVSRNKIDWVQNIDVPTALTGRVLSFNIIQSGKSTNNFAWDAGVGVDYSFNDQFSVAIGYRFVDVGALESKNKFIDKVSGINTTITPFKTKHIYLNEVSASISYHFDCLI